MQFLTSLGAVAGLLAFTQASPLEATALSSRQSSDSCATGVHIIALPGEGQSPPNLSLLQSLVTNILNSIPGSDFYQVPYPLPQNSTDGKRITTVGAQMTRQAIRDYHKSCANTPIVMAGYSAGGIITMNAICGQSPPYDPQKPMKKKFAQQIIATITYGDQTFRGGEDFDQGTCFFDFNNLKLTRSQENVDACYNFTPNVQEYCDQGDGQCCSNGNDPNAHFGYAKYDDDATSYVVDKYNARTGQNLKVASAKKAGN